MKVLTYLASFLLLAATSGLAQNSLQIQAQLWEVSQTKALEFIDSAKGQKDVTALVDGLEEQLAAGSEEVKLLSLPSIVSRSGQRARVSSGAQEYISSYKASPDGKTDMAVRGRAILGTELEVDPVLGPDGQVMDVNFAFKHALSEPEFEEITVKGPVTGDDLQAERVKENAAEMVSAITIKNGETHFLGTVPQSKSGTTLLLVFLHANVQE